MSNKEYGKLEQELEKLEQSFVKNEKYLYVRRWLGITLTSGQIFLPAFLFMPLGVRFLGWTAFAYMPVLAALFLGGGFALGRSALKAREGCATLDDADEDDMADVLPEVPDTKWQPHVAATQTVFGRPGRGAATALVWATCFLDSLVGLVLCSKITVALLPRTFLASWSDCNKIRVFLLPITLLTVVLTCIPSRRHIQVASTYLILCGSLYVVLCMLMSVYKPMESRTGGFSLSQSPTQFLQGISILMFGLSRATGFASLNHRRVHPLESSACMGWSKVIVMLLYIPLMAISYKTYGLDLNDNAAVLMVDATRDYRAHRYIIGIIMAVLIGIMMAICFNVAFTMKRIVEDIENSVIFSQQPRGKHQLSRLVLVLLLLPLPELVPCDISWVTFTGGVVVPWTCIILPLLAYVAVEPDLHPAHVLVILASCLMAIVLAVATTGIGFAALVNAARQSI